MSDENCNQTDFMIEMHSSFKMRLDIAELVLKALNIKYKIVTSKSHTTRLYNKSLDQIQDTLVALNEGYKRYTKEKILDSETRKYWREKFQKLQN